MADSKIKQAHIETIAEEEKTDIEDETPQKFNKTDKRIQRKNNLDQATVEDKQITFISNHSD